MSTPNPYPSQFMRSPDGIRLAIRHPESPGGLLGAPWQCTDGSNLRDDQVRGWSPLRTMSLSEVLEAEAVARALDGS